jgi:DNA-binding transcriptional ArsR family regulator
VLDIDLIQEKPALTTEFQVSLAADFICTMSLVLDASSIEGLEQWIYTTHAALSEQMRVDMAIVLIVGTKSTVYYTWLNNLRRGDPAHRDFAAFVSWLNSHSVGDYEQLLKSFIGVAREHCGAEEAASSDEAVIMRACYGEMLKEPQIERLLQLYRSPAEFKAQLISVVTRFWEEFYRADFGRCLAQMDRSVGYHRQKSYSADLVSTFVDVTGRRFPKGYDEYHNAEHVIFVPSCHIGPYVMLSPCDDTGSTILIHYNARSTGAPEPLEAAHIQELFPPLKALADETRLQILSLLNGRELYAQEIVDQLEISQSAVSRHLQLMVTGGVLDVRKEESMKYFSINESTLAALAGSLKRFRAH